MTRKKQRVMLLVVGGVILSLSAFLVMTALRDSVVFFYAPTELLSRNPQPDQLLRVGGLVATDSLERGQGREVRFVVTDGANSISVGFIGVLPDLFREGQGVIAEGYLRGGTFEAVDVLAKHDENYMPREVAEELKKTGQWKPAE